MQYLYIDILKIIAMAGIVLMHTVAYSISLVQGVSWHYFVFINAALRFAVPIFIMCSGAMLLKKNCGETNNVFFRKRFSRVVVPLIAWSLLYEAHVLSWGGDKSIWGILCDIYANTIMYHMWFLYLILIIYALVPLLRKLVNTLELCDYQYLLIIFAIFTLHGIIGIITGAYQPDDLNVRTFLPYAIGYFILGYYFHNNLGFFYCRRVVLISLGVYGLLVLAIHKLTLTYGSTVLREVFWSPDSLFILLETIILFAVLASSEKILQQLFGTRSRRLLATVSDLTFGCYLLHVYVLDKIMGYYYQGNLYNAAHPVIAAIMVATSVFIICLLIVFILKKLPILKRIV